MASAGSAAWAPDPQIVAIDNIPTKAARIANPLSCHCRSPPSVLRRRRQYVPVSGDPSLLHEFVV
jgi:hypothetical protein